MAGNSMILYHGSKSGIKGNIAPISRDKCDFGKGFYMGTERTQPLTLICNYPKARLYAVKIDLSGLRILSIDVGIEWALLIAYNRGKMEGIKTSSIYKHYEKMSRGYDLIIGSIANDRMFVVLDRFFNGDITDVALINSLSVLKLGKQYVALTEKACERIIIVDEYVLSGEEREILKQENLQNRAKGVAMAEEICRKYRREGRYFDELIKERD